MDRHLFWMNRAIQNAKKAEKLQEVPIGAVMVDANNEWLADGFNQTIQLCDPSAHAEILAIRQACRVKKNHLLPHTRLYVTVQPCLICLMLALHARVETIIFGAPSQKQWPLFSAAEREKLWSLWEFQPGEKTNFAAALSAPLQLGRLSLQGGILEKECADIVQSFFRKKRRLDADPILEKGD